MYHFRDRDGAEVDVVLEAADGRVVAVEIKATSTPRPEDFRWLALLHERIDAVGMIALPAADLWS